VAAVEFAIVLPVLLLLFIGIIEFSTLWYDQAMLTNASREGARVGVVVAGWDDDDNPIRVSDEDITNVVNTYAAANLITFGEDDTLDPPTIIRSDDDTDGVDDAGESLTVTVTYDYGFLILPSFVSGFSDVFTLRAKAIMRFE
jgi:Flp pilus assembly protein TadG